MKRRAPSMRKGEANTTSRNHNLSACGAGGLIRSRTQQTMSLGASKRTSYSKPDGRNVPPISCTWRTARRFRLQREAGDAEEEQQSGLGNAVAKRQKTKNTSDHSCTKGYIAACSESSASTADKTLSQPAATRSTSRTLRRTNNPQHEYAALHTEGTTVRVSLEKQQSENGELHEPSSSRLLEEEAPEHIQQNTPPESEHIGHRLVDFYKFKQLAELDANDLLRHSATTRAGIERAPSTVVKQLRLPPGLREPQEDWTPRRFMLFQTLHNVLWTSIRPLVASLNEWTERCVTLHIEDYMQRRAFGRNLGCRLPKLCDTSLFPLAPRLPISKLSAAYSAIWSFTVHNTPGAAVCYLVFVTCLHLFAQRLLRCSGRMQKLVQEMLSSRKRIGLRDLRNSNVTSVVQLTGNHNDEVSSDSSCARAIAQTLPQSGEHPTPQPHHGSTLRTPGSDVRVGALFVECGSPSAQENSQLKLSEQKHKASRGSCGRRFRSNRKCVPGSPRPSACFSVEFIQKKKDDSHRISSGPRQESGTYSAGATCSLDCTKVEDHFSSQRTTLNQLYLSANFTDFRVSSQKSKDSEIPPPVEFVTRFVASWRTYLHFASALSKIFSALENVASEQLKMTLTGWDTLLATPSNTNVKKSSLLCPSSINENTRKHGDKIPPVLGRARFTLPEVMPRKSQIHDFNCQDSAYADGTDDEISFIDTITTWLSDLLHIDLQQVRQNAGDSSATTWSDGLKTDKANTGQEPNRQHAPSTMSALACASCSRCSPTRAVEVASALRKQAIPIATAALRTFQAVVTKPFETAFRLSVSYCLKEVRLQVLHNVLIRRIIAVLDVPRTTDLEATAAQVDRAPRRTHAGEVPRYPSGVAKQLVADSVQTTIIGGEASRVICCGCCCTGEAYYGRARRRQLQVEHRAETQLHASFSTVDPQASCVYAPDALFRQQGFTMAEKPSLYVGAQPKCGNTTESWTSVSVQPSDATTLQTTASRRPGLHRVLLREAILVLRRLRDTTEVCITHTADQAVGEANLPVAGNSSRRGTHCIDYSVVKTSQTSVASSATLRSPSDISGGCVKDDSMTRIPRCNVMDDRGEKGTFSSWGCPQWAVFRQDSWSGNMKEEEKITRWLVEKTGQFYMGIGRSLLRERIPLLVYMRFVLHAVQEENELARNYLHAEVREKVQQAAAAALVRYHTQHVLELPPGLIGLLEEGDWTNIRAVFNLLRRWPEDAFNAFATACKKWWTSRFAFSLCSSNVDVSQSSGLSPIATYNLPSRRQLLVGTRQAHSPSDHTSPSDRLACGDTTTERAGARTKPAAKHITDVSVASDIEEKTHFTLSYELGNETSCDDSQAGRLFGDVDKKNQSHAVSIISTLIRERASTELDLVLHLDNHPVLRRARDELCVYEKALEAILKEASTQSLNKSLCHRAELDQTKTVTTRTVAMDACIGLPIRSQAWNLTKATFYVEPPIKISSAVLHYTEHQVETFRRREYIHALRPLSVEDLQEAAEHKPFTCELTLAKAENATKHSNVSAAIQCSRRITPIYTSETVQGGLAVSVEAGEKKARRLLFDSEKTEGYLDHLYPIIQLMPDRELLYGVYKRRAAFRVLAATQRMPFKKLSLSQGSPQLWKDQALQKATARVLQHEWKVLRDVMEAAASDATKQQEAWRLQQIFADLDATPMLMQQFTEWSRLALACPQASVKDTMKEIPSSSFPCRRHCLQESCKGCVRRLATSKNDKKDLLKSTCDRQSEAVGKAGKPCLLKIGGAKWEPHASFIDAPGKTGNHSAVHSRALPAFIFDCIILTKHAWVTAFQPCDLSPVVRKHNASTVAPRRHVTPETGERQVRQKQRTEGAKDSFETAVFHIAGGVDCDHAAPNGPSRVVATRADDKEPTHATTKVTAPFLECSPETLTATNYHTSSEAPNAASSEDAKGGDVVRVRRKSTSRSGAAAGWKTVPYTNCSTVPEVNSYIMFAGLRLPRSLVAPMETFAVFYQERFPERRLNWQMHLSTLLLSRTCFPVARPGPSSKHRKHPIRTARARAYGRKAGGASTKNEWSGTSSAGDSKTDDCDRECEVGVHWRSITSTSPIHDVQDEQRHRSTVFIDVPAAMGVILLLFNRRTSLNVHSMCELTGLCLLDTMKLLAALLRRTSSGRVPLLALHHLPDRLSDSASACRCTSALSSSPSNDVEALWSLPSQSQGEEWEVVVNEQAFDSQPDGAYIELRPLEDSFFTDAVPEFATSYKGHKGTCPLSMSNSVASPPSPGRGQKGPLPGGCTLSSTFRNNNTRMPPRADSQGVSNSTNPDFAQEDTCDGGVATRTNAFFDLVAVIEAAIVRIMKRQRRLKHLELLQAVQAHLQKTLRESVTYQQRKHHELKEANSIVTRNHVYVAGDGTGEPTRGTAEDESPCRAKKMESSTPRCFSVASFKKRIESLLEKEFLARDENDKSTYIYIP